MNRFFWRRQPYHFKQTTYKFNKEEEMKHEKRVLGIMLTLAMAVGLLGGCGNASDIESADEKQRQRPRKEVPKQLKRKVRRICT